MSRRPRLVLPGVPMHIIQRGNNRRACFFHSEDYQVYLSMLRDASFQSGCSIHAYVLMPNHVHLLATPPAASSAASLMKIVGQKYVQYINRRQERFGTLWQGRYRSCLVGDERYFLICHRYIELNPVRAGIAAHPMDYEWSSYRCNAVGQSSQLIVPHSFYTNLSAEKSERERFYRGLFSEEMPELMFSQLRLATNGDVALGPDKLSHELSIRMQRNMRHPPPENSKSK
jgi:putative transposase